MHVVFVMLLEILFAGMVATMLLVALMPIITLLVTFTVLVTVTPFVTVTFLIVVLATAGRCGGSHRDG
jgi:hypothetical protein